MVARPSKIPECGYVSDPDHNGDYTVCENESVGLNKHGIARCQKHDGDHYKYAPAPGVKAEEMKPMPPKNIPVETRKCTDHPDCCFLYRHTFTCRDSRGEALQPIDSEYEYPEEAIQAAFLAGRAQQTLADIKVVEAKWRGSVLHPFYMRGLLDDRSYETMEALCEGPENTPVLDIIERMAERLAEHERRRKCIHDDTEAADPDRFDMLATEAFNVAKGAGIGILDAIMLAASVAQEVYGTKGLRVTLRFPWRKGRK